MSFQENNLLIEDEQLQNKQYPHSMVNNQNQMNNNNNNNDNNDNNNNNNEIQDNPNQTHQQINKLQKDMLSLQKKLNEMIKQQLESNQEQQKLKNEQEIQLKYIQQLEGQLHKQENLQKIFTNTKNLLDNSLQELKKIIAGFQSSINIYLNQKQVELTKQKKIQNQLAFLPKFEMLDDKIEQVQKQILELQSKNSFIEFNTQKSQEQVQCLMVDVKNLKFNYSYEVKQTVDKYLKEMETRKHNTNTNKQT